MTEHKPDTYQKFAEFMLPTQWFDLEADTDDAITKLARRLLDTCSTDGKYVIKGGWSCCAIAVQFIDVKGGRCPKLWNIVEALVRRNHQLQIGIQHFVADFKNNEVRHFCIPVTNGSTRRWLLSFAVRTYWTDQGIAAESCAPLHEDTIAMHLLVQELLSDPRHREFFDRLHRMGIPMLRIDCSYDHTKKRAFLNEFAQAPDAAMWTHVHQQDAIWFVPTLMAEQIANMLDAAQ